MLIDCHPTDDRTFGAICQAHRWRRTVQRRVVFACLCGNTLHPTVETVWREARRTLPDVSLDSIYRILDDFALAGVVRRLDGAGAVRYDADTREHGHFLCKACGRLHDFPLPCREDMLRDGAQAGLVERLEVVAYGMCNDCAGRNTI